MVSLRGWPGFALALVALGAALATAGGGARAGANAPAAADALTQDKLVRFVASHSAEVRACYGVALRKTAGLSVRVEATFTIDTTGKAVDIGFGEKPPIDAEFAACLKRTIAAWRFPAPTEATGVTFPFVFQTPEAANRSGSQQPSGAAADGPAGTDKPGWIAARKWLAALGRYDADGVAQLTSFPLRYRTVGMKRDCVMDSRDATALKKWMDCLRKAKSQITGEIAAGADIEYTTLPSAALEKASKGLTGGEWVPASINGKGVKLQFRLLVSPGDADAPTVKAFVVSASVDEG